MLVILFFAQNIFAAPNSLTFQAKIVKPNQVNLEEPSVYFKFKYTDAQGLCVVYEEEFSSVDMTGSKGLVSLELGAGVKTYPPAAITMYDVFNFGTALSCQGATPTPTVTPTAVERRKVIVQFNDGSGLQTLPIMNLNAVPFALHSTMANNSNQLGGLSASQYTRYSDITAAGCVAGQALRYTGVAFVCETITGAGVTTVTATAPVLSSGGANPNISIPKATSATNGYLASSDWSVFNSKLSNFSTLTSTDITTALSFTPLNRASNLSDLASATTARTNLGLGTAAVLNAAASGDATATEVVKGNDTRLTGAIQTSTSLSGDVTGTISATVVNSVGGVTSANVATGANAANAATNLNTASTIVRRNASGDFTAGTINATTFSGTNASATNVSTQNVYLYDSVNTDRIIFRAPTAGITNYTLTLPPAVGTNGQVLSTNASGDLSWVNAAVGGVTSVTATAPLVSSGGASPDISMAKATATADGYLASSDFSIFSSKLSNFSTMISTDVTTALGYTPLNAAGAVTSVAGRTGAVTLTSADISGLGNSAGLNVGAAAGTVAAGNDARFIDARAPTGAASGDLTGTYPNPTLTTTGVGAGSYSRVTVDTKGRVTAGVASLDLTTSVSGALPIANGGTGQITAILGFNALSPLSAKGDILTRDGTNNIRLPAGADGLVLKTNSATASGLEWAAASAGTVGTVTATAPLVSSGGASPDISLAKATATADGYLASSDWTTFSNKLSNFSTMISTDVTTALTYIPLNRASNLSDLANTTTARSNLGLGTAAVLNGASSGDATAAELVKGDDSRLTDARTPTGTASGDLTGTYPNPTLINVVTAGTSSKVTFDAKGRIISSASLISTDITGALGYTPTNAAGAVTSVAGRTGAVNLTSADISGLGNSAGLNVGAVAGTVAAGDDSRLTDARAPTGAASGDLTGTYPNPTLTTTGVSAGTYSRVTVDAKGRVAAGVASLDLTTAVSGALPLANGGTGQITAILGFNALSPLSAKGDILTRDGTNNIRLPAGADGLVLKTNSATASGLEWAAASAGTVGTVTATAPLVSSGGASPDISLAKATAGVDGYLASSDFTIFSNKLGNFSTMISTDVTTALTFIPLNRASNLSDLANTTTARSNLGLGTAAVFNGASSGDATATELVIGNDTRLTDSRAPTGAASGDLTGTYPNPTLINVVTAGTSSKVTFDAKGRIISSASLISTDVTTALGYTPLNAAGAVTSVAGRTGIVTLTSADISGLGNSAGLNVGAAAGTVAAGDDARFTDSRTPSGAASGDLTGTYPNPTLTTTGVSAGSYSTVTVDTKGRVTAGVASLDLTTSVAGALPITNGGTGQITALLGFNALSPLSAKGDIITRDGTNNIRLPAGADGLVLKTNSATASGLEWAAASSGTVGTVTATAPLVSSGGASPDISLARATAGVDGYLASSDFTIFSNKLGTATAFSGDVTGTYNATVLADSGVSAGSYSRVTVDSKGRVTAGAASLDLTTAISGVLPIANGGTNASAFTNTYGVGYFDGTRLVTSPAGAANQLMVQTVAGPIWTTATYPSVTTANQFLYSSANNTVTGLATAANSVLTTNASGDPSWSVISGDVYSQYALLAGRAGGQTLRGGTLASQDLILDSTAHATKGNIILNSIGGNVGIGTAAPSYALQVSGDVSISGDYKVNGVSIGSGTVGSVTAATTTGNPITVSSSATSPSIDITRATASVNGYLASSDFSTFTAKLTSALNSASIFVGNGSNVATAQVLSGDATLDNAGILTLVNNSVTGAKILNGTITSADLSNTVADGLWTVSGADVFRSVGNVGIGTSSPSATLHVQNGTVLASGTTGATPISGAGTRMLWVPAKAAFRAGNVTGTQWDDANIGLGSMALGSDNKASGQYAVSLGIQNTASGDYSVAMGVGNTASGSAATTIGRNSTASAADTSTTIGAANTASGNFSTAVGFSVTAGSYAQTTVGQYNLPTGSESPTSWNTANPLFVVGNGTGPGGSRSNAMMILKNGNVGIGMTAPGYALQVSGDLSISGNYKVNGVNIGSGTVGSVTAAATAGNPISVSSSTTSPSIDITRATASVNGYLASSDFSTFNAKLTSALNSASIFVGNGSNVATAQVLSGDATINNSGDLTIASNAITGAKILNATITSADLSTSLTDTFWTLNASGDVSRATGKVGIGTTSPTAGLHVALAGAASTPAERLNGAWFTGGTATTTKPQLLIEPSGATSTAWSTDGTGFGINAASGFAGNLIDAQLNGVSKFKVDSTGKVTGDGSGLTGVVSTPALSAITAATATNTIDNLLNAQTWNWSTATTQSPLSISANSLTTGSLLNLTSSSASVNSTNGLLYVANTGASTTGVVARIQSNSTAGSGMTVLANGNVGIGTASPSATLDVNGSAKIATNWTITSSTITNSNSPNAARLWWNTFSGTPSFGFNGDTNSGMGRVAEDTVAIYTGGVERITADPSGNVGIGTMTPGYALQVSGDVSISGNYKVNGVNIGTGTVGSVTAATTTGNPITVSSSTSSPSIDITRATASVNGYLASSDFSTFAAKLSGALNSASIFVGNGSNVATPQVLSGDATLDNAGILTLVNNSVSGAKILNGTITSADLTSSVVNALWTVNGSGDVSRASGYVGIGTASPFAPLHVMALTGSVLPALRLENSTGDSSIRFDTDGGSYAIGMDRSDSSKFKVSKSTALGTNDYFTVDGAGNVGIGTSTPSDFLTVKADQNAETKMLISNEDAGAAARTSIRLQSSSTTGAISLYSVNHATTPSLFRVLSNSTTGDLRFYLNGDDRITVRPTGNVGIGTTAPGYALEVSGDVSISGNYKVNGVNIGSGTIGSVTAATTTGNPITVSSSTTSPSIDITRATASVNGYLASSDFSTFAAKLNSALSSASIFVGNGSNVATAQVLSGDATLDNAGILTLVNNSVTSAKIFDGTITSADLTSSVAIALWSVNGSGDVSRMTGNVGIGTTTPNTALDVNGAFSVREMAAPGLSPADQGRIYFDSTANKFKVSEHGGAYVDLLGGGSSLPAANGTVAAPSIAFSSKLDTGIFQSDPGTGYNGIGFSVNNTAAIGVQSNRIVVPNNMPIQFVTGTGLGGSTLCPYSICVNGFAAVQTPTLADTRQVLGTSDSAAAVGGGLYITAGGANNGGWATDANGGSLILGSGRSTGTGTSDILFYTPTSAASGNTPNTPVEKMRITSAGNVGIGIAAPTAGLHIALAGAASTPAERLNGAWFTGGTATTTKPQLLIEPSGATSTAWSTDGTGFGINAASGFTGNLIDAQLNGVSKFKVDSTGKVTGDGSGLTGVVSTPALSAITAATATNTIDNLLNAQVWNWSTATTQNPLSMSANALTTGSGLSVTTSSASLNSTNGLLRVANTGASTAGTLARFQSNSDGNSGLTVMGNGKVGIGLPNPSYYFDVSYNPGIAAYQNQDLVRFSEGWNGKGLVFGVTVGATANSIVNSYIYSTSGDLTLSGATASDRVVLQGNGGKVGIGTTSPGYALQVSGDVSISGNYKVNGVNIGSGTVGSVTAAATAGNPITVSSSTTSPSIDITRATASVNGYLASSDFSTFTAKLTSVLSSASIFVGNGSNVATAAVLSGDATLSNTGILTIVNNAITGAKILNATITSADLSTSLTDTFWTLNASGDVSRATGNVGIGTTAPIAGLDVRKQIRSVSSTGSVHSNTGTAVDWNNGNTQIITSSCGAFTFSNMIEGGTYTLVVTGTTSGTCSFSQASPDTLASGAFKFVPAITSTTAGTSTVFTMMRAGNLIYVSWITGY